MEIAKARNKSVEDYNKLKTEVDLHYPNRGEHSNKRYETQSKKSASHSGEGESEDGKPKRLNLEK